MEVLRINGDLHHQFALNAGQLLRHVQQVANGELKLPVAPLQKLRGIELFNASTIKPLLPLLALPTVTQLFVRRVDEVQPELATHMLEHFPPNLSVFSVVEADLTPGLTNGIISSSSNLQQLTFAFRHVGDWPFHCGCLVDTRDGARLIPHLIGDTQSLQGFKKSCNQEGTLDDVDPAKIIVHRFTKPRCRYVVDHDLPSRS